MIDQHRADAHAHFFSASVQARERKEECRNLYWGNSKPSMENLPSSRNMFLCTMVFTSWKPKIGRVVLHGNTKKSEDWPFFCASAKKVKVVEKSRNIAKLIVKNKNDKKWKRPALKFSRYPEEQPCQFLSFNSQKYDTKSSRQSRNRPPVAGTSSYNSCCGHKLRHHRYTALYCPAWVEIKGKYNALSRSIPAVHTHLSEAVNLLLLCLPSDNEWVVLKKDQHKVSEELSRTYCAYIFH